MSFPEWRLTKQKISMAEKVGRILGFMKDTACVHVEQREEIAFCEIYKLINPEDKEFNDFLNVVAIPALVKLGQARWYRDTITDLGFALSGRTFSWQDVDTKDVLEAEIK